MKSIDIDVSLIKTIFNRIRVMRGSGDLKSKKKFSGADWVETGIKAPNERILRKRIFALKAVNLLVCEKTFE